MTVTEAVLNAFTAIFISFNPEATERLLAPDYIQHNVALPTGAEPVISVIPALKSSGISATTHRIISEGDLVVMHNTYNNATLFGSEHLVAFDVFRVEDGLVAEHWDNLAPITSPNQSGHSQVDGETEITDRAATAQNKDLVTDFIKTVMINGETARITEFISTETYTQHNSSIADGLDGLNAAITAMAEQGISMLYTDLKIAVAEGNFVFTASEGTLADVPTAFFDLFRVEDGQIVEHWDVISDIPEEMAHDNGKF